MISKKIYKIGIYALIIFIGVASYFWYSYFKDGENEILSQNENSEFLRGVELTNSGGIDYINATNTDEDSIIPVYYFRVKNNTDKKFEYVLYFENATVSDGCTTETTFSRDELEYELKLDNKTVKKGDLSSIKNNELYINEIEAKAINDYSLRVKLKESVKDYDDKHFHYVVTMKEKK